MKVESEAVRNDRAQRSDARASRRRLLVAAKELVAEDGLDALTVVGVARRAGLNRSTAYQHFPQRKDLVDAVGTEFARELRAMFSEPRELGEQIEFFSHHFREHPNIARIWMFHLLHDDDGVSKPGWDDYVSALQNLADSPRGQDGIDAEMLCVIGMTSALVWSLMVRERTSGEEQARVETNRFARELKRLFLHGALRPEQWPDLVSELSE
jgi:AcrR family transcriptional regulator